MTTRQLCCTSLPTFLLVLSHFLPVCGASGGALVPGSGPDDPRRSPSFLGDGKVLTLIFLQAKQLLYSRSPSVRNGILCATETLRGFFKVQLIPKCRCSNVTSAQCNSYHRISCKYCKCCLIGTEVGYSSEIFKEGLFTHHFVLFFGGGNAFSGEFEKKKKDQGSTVSLVQININKYIYKYILYILLIFVQFCILHSCKVCF